MYTKQKIYQYHIVLKYIAPLVIFGTSFIYFLYTELNIIEAVINLEFCSILLHLLGISSIFASLYILHLYSQSYLIISSESLLLHRPGKIIKIKYDDIDKVIISPFGNDIKSIYLIHNNKTTSLYGLYNLEGVLRDLKIHLNKNLFQWIKGL